MKNSLNDRDQVVAKARLLAQDGSFLTILKQKMSLENGAKECIV